MPFISKYRLVWPSRRVLLMVCGVASLLVLRVPGNAQLNQDCVVSALNRTVQAGADGKWVIPNVPANVGQVRARVTCIRNGVTVSGQSDFFSVPTNGVVGPVGITFGHLDPVPASLTLSTPDRTLRSIGNITQLRVTASVAGGIRRDLTSSASGTNYTTSNPAVATVSPDGLITAKSSGTAVISAMNEGALGVIAINVVLSGASHGGIPDDWAIAHGLDPNDPAMPFEDPDHDGLTNLQEFQHGTDPHNPDTDGDGIPDGLEIAEGTDPLNPNSFNLGRALKSIQVTPPAFTLNFNTLLGEGSRQLIVTGTLKDANATQIDLTSTRKGTNYTSSDLTVCNFGAVDGQVFAGNSGTCTITVTNNGFTAKTTGIIKTFSPTPLSFVPIPGFANNVKVNGNFAYVAAGSAGLQVVDVTDRTAPKIVASLATSGNANDLRVVGNKVYLAAGAAGLLVIDVSNPLSPTLLGSLATPDTAWDVAIAGNLAFIAAGSSGLRIASISDPTNPTFISSTVAAPSCALGTAKGVAVSSNFALVAAGSGGLQVVDISDPANPQILGCAGMPSGDARKVQVKGTTAFVAPFPDSLQIVDFSVPFNPVIVGTTSLTLGGRLQDVAVVSALGQTLAFGADVFFVNGVPITDVTVPNNPVARAIIDFRQFRDDNGHGIAVDSAFVYMTGEEGTISDNGVSGDTRLYIGQYLALEDTAGIPPTAFISSPTAGTTVIERQTIPVTVVATDDIAVASVSFSVNGQTVDTQTSPPYQFSFQTPAGVSTVTLGATAIDLGGNLGNALPVQLNIIPDPGTTVVGRVVDSNGNPVAGATVSTLGSRSAITLADGSFSITQIPTVLGNIVATVSFVTPDGTILGGASSPAAPVPFGITRVNTAPSTKTVIPQGSTWKFSLSNPAGFEQPDFDDSGFTSGQAPFTNCVGGSCGCPLIGISNFPTFATLDLRTKINLPQGTTNAVASVAIDNDFTLWINGTQVTNQGSEGCAVRWNRVVPIPNTLLLPGTNVVAVQARDRGGLTGFDLQLAADFPGSDAIIIVPVPTITSLSRRSALAGSQVTLQVTGTFLSGATFAFQSDTAPAVPAQVNSIDATGTFASLAVSFPVGVKGTFALAASNGTGSSSTKITALNRFTVIDPRSSADSDGDGFSDVLEATFGSDPLDAGSLPSIPKPVGEAESLSFAVINGFTPATINANNVETEGLSFSVQNGFIPAAVNPGKAEVESAGFSVQNGFTPAAVNIRTAEWESLSFSVLNGVAPATTNTLSAEAESLAFSVRNGAASGSANVTAAEAESPTFSVLNGTGPPLVNLTTMESESLSFSVVNTAPVAANRASRPKAQAVASLGQSQRSKELSLAGNRAKTTTRNRLWNSLLAFLGVRRPPQTPAALSGDDLNQGQQQGQGQNSSDAGSTSGSKSDSGNKSASTPGRGNE